jgi:tetratricopeptide (TPR) repeat protein
VVKADGSVARPAGKKLMIPIIVAASLAVLVVVGYFLIPQIKLRQFYNTFRQQKEAAQQPVVTTTPAAEAEETERKHAQLVTHAKQLYNQRRYLLAYYLFLHANTLKNLSDTDQQFLSAARNEMGQEVNESRVSRQAERAFADGNYDEAIAAYYSLLSNQPENIRYKKRLIESYEQAGVQHAYEGDGATAQEYFSYAEILDPANPILKRHKEVMSRYISGLISKRQVQEWFYFFR